MAEIKLGGARTWAQAAGKVWPPSERTAATPTPEVIVKVMPGVITWVVCRAFLVFVTKQVVRPAPS